MCLWVDFPCLTSLFPTLVLVLAQDPCPDKRQKPLVAGLPGICEAVNLPVQGVAGFRQLHSEGLIET